LNLEDTSTTAFATISGGRHLKACKTGLSRVLTLCNCSKRVAPLKPLAGGRQARLGADLAALTDPLGEWATRIRHSAPPEGSANVLDRAAAGVVLMLLSPIGPPTGRRWQARLSQNQGPADAWHLERRRCRLTSATVARPEHVERSAISLRMNPKVCWPKCAFRDDSSRLAWRNITCSNERRTKTATGGVIARRFHSLEHHHDNHNCHAPSNSGRLLITPLRVPGPLPEVTFAAASWRRFVVQSSVRLQTAALPTRS